MTELLPFFIVLFAGLIFSEVFRRFHFPWVIALILGGIVIGPHGIDWFHGNDTIDFLAEIGLVFLMFMAGLETHLGTLREAKREVVTLASLNSLIPFIAGLFIAISLGYSMTTAILLGIIFISSSIAVIIPTLESTGLIHSKLGRLLIGSTIIEDIMSLLLLSVLLQVTEPTTALPLPLYYVFLIGFLLFLRWVIPGIKWLFSTYVASEKDIFQEEFRIVLTILIGTVLLFELLGLHSIIAGFFAGLVLSGTISHESLLEKVRSIGYGLFVPIFFVSVGTNTDISVFKQAGEVLPVVALVVGGLIVSKIFSGWLAARFSGMTRREGLLVGSATIPQLSTTLAVAFTGLGLGIIDTKMITALVVLTIVTTFLSPILVKYFK